MINKNKNILPVFHKTAIIVAKIFYQRLRAKIINCRNFKFRSSPLDVLLGKGVLKIFSKLTGEHPCRSASSINLQSNFIEITLRHGCSLVNLLHVFRTPFPKSTSGGMLL